MENTWTTIKKDFDFIVNLWSLTGIEIDCNI